MRTILKTLSFFALIIFTLNGCQVDDKYNDENIVKKEVASIPVDKDDPYIIHIIQKGFSVGDIRQFEDFYILQDDIIFYKTDIQYELSNRHIHYNSVVDIERVRTMSIKVDVSVPQGNGWEQAVTSAVSEWNNIADCRVNFIIIPTTSTLNANIYVASDFGTLPSNIPVVAALPSNGNPGDQIKINLDYPNLGALTAAQKMRIITHELGHIIGFGHTDFRLTNENISSFTQILTTTNAEDPNSVLNSSLTTAVGFSPQDLVASKYLYPEIYSNSTNFYRYYLNNKHFYTSNFSELGGSYLEGVLGKICKTQIPLTFPLYRYRKVNGGHYYILNNQVSLPGLIYEGIAGYAYNTQQPGTKAIHRFYSPQNDNHFYTDSFAEGNGASSYGYEGVAYYLLN